MNHDLVTAARKDDDPIQVALVNQRVNEQLQFYANAHGVHIGEPGIELEFGTIWEAPLIEKAVFFCPTNSEVGGGELQWVRRYMETGEK